MKRVLGGVYYLRTDVPLHLPLHVYVPTENGLNCFLCFLFFLQRPDPRRTHLLLACTQSLHRRASEFRVSPPSAACSTFRTLFPGYQSLSHRRVKEC